MGNPFRRIYVGVSPYGNNIITWDLEPKFCYPVSPIQIYVDRIMDGDVTPLNPLTPVTDRTSFIDTARVLWRPNQTVYYRVRIKSGSEVYVSEDVRFQAGMTRTDWLTARGTIAAHYVDFNRGRVAESGALFKRKWIGERCPTCTDPSNGGVTDSRCEDCYGTGITGGYLPPLTMPVKLKSGSTGAQFTKDKSLEEFSKNMGKLIPFPMVDTGDLWVSFDTGKVFEVKSWQHETSMRGVPIITSVIFSEVPPTDIKYKLGAITSSRLLSEIIDSVEGIEPTAFNDQSTVEGWSLEDGYLSIQYGEASWIRVPVFTNTVDLTANPGEIIMNGNTLILNAFGFGELEIAVITAGVPDAPAEVGEWSVTDGYLYVCYATNKWCKRSITTNF